MPRTTSRPISSPFTALNAELAKLWKPIIERKPAPADADEWKGVKDKLQVSRAIAASRGVGDRVRPALRSRV